MHSDTALDSSIGIPLEIAILHVFVSPPLIYVHWKPGCQAGVSIRKITAIVRRVHPIVAIRHLVPQSLILSVGRGNIYPKT